jgi:SEC-C motif
MVFDPLVIGALGSQRAKKVNEASEGLQRLVEAAPQASTVVVHIPVDLRAKTALEAVEELAARLERMDPSENWVYETARKPDNTHIGKASPFISSSNTVGTDEWFTYFLLSDLHTRLSGWWLTQLWRAADLTAGALTAIADWNILVAAAWSRSLLEGAAAFMAETEAIADEWDVFKRAGTPTRRSAEIFFETFNEKVARLLYASRLSAVKDKSPSLLSTNVLTYIKKLARKTEDYDVIDIYEWLCDAVHPSFGSSTAYVVINKKHNTGTHVVQEFAHRPLPELAKTDFATTPTVAHAAADAIIIAGRLLLDYLAKARWLVYDFGMTSEVAFNMRLNYYGRVGIPGRNERCPCGSGRKFKACVHRWGDSAERPAAPKAP